MFSEVFMMTFLLLLSSQSSSLWSSLIIIPLSMSVILISSSFNIFSSLFFFMFIMVFIGGLLVLLLSVASISFQEQSYNFTKMWILFVILSGSPFIFSYKCSTFSSSFAISLSWLEEQSNMFLPLVFILLISLLTMSKLILSFKGLIRSL